MSNNNEQLKKVEDLCDKLFMSNDIQIKNEAQTQLLVLVSTPEFIPQCQFILDNSQNPYALLVASTSLTKLVTDHWNNFNSEQKNQIRNYVLQFLALKGVNLPGFAVPPIIKLLARITKLGWLENQSQETLVELRKFIDAPINHKILGTKIYSALISELDTPQHNNPTQDDRKIAYYFRELYLRDIFVSAKEMLDTIRMANIEMTDQQKVELTENSLLLFKECLNFDFIGTNPDESTIETGPVYAPISWKDVLINEDTLNILVELYYMNEPPVTCYILECLLYLVSIRRTIFSENNSRNDFLTKILQILIDLLLSSRGLDDPDTFHMFCRLLGRLKANYQLSDIISIADYERFIQLVSKFTCNAFRKWDWSGNSSLYLLLFWSRFVAAVPTLQDNDHQHKLNPLVHEICESYITGRINSVPTYINNPDEDLLLNIETLDSEMKYLNSIFRFEYISTGEVLCRYFDDISAKYEQLLVSAAITNDTNVKLVICECELSWIIHFIAAIFYCQSYDNPQGYEQVDANLGRRVFQFVGNTNLKAVEIKGYLCDQRLELAITQFFYHFKLVYISDQYCIPNNNLTFNVDTQIQNQSLRLMFDQLEQGDNKSIIGLIISKITSNLKCWNNNQLIIKNTLELFKELSTSYASRKILFDLNEVQYMIGNHTAETFGFLNIPKNFSFRTLYYLNLTNLVLLENSKFELFMVPFLQTLDRLKMIEVNNGPSEIALAVGLFRDLRGVVKAITNASQYSTFFELIYPTYFPVFKSILKVNFLNKDIISSFLTFISELLSNSQGRIKFGASSPNGILLFRDTANLINAFSKTILSSEIAKSADIYSKVVKLVIDCYNKAFVGDYCNFGVFEVYQDRVLEDAFRTVFSLVFTLDKSILLALPKIAHNYFEYIDLFFRNFIQFLVTFDSSIILAIIETLQNGLNSIDVQVITHSCSSLNYLATFYYNNFKKNTQLAVTFRSLIPPECNLWVDLLYSLFIICLSDKTTKILYTYARPMLPFILIHPNCLELAKDKLKTFQPADSHQKIDEVFAQLVNGVANNLDIPNRELFTTRLSQFKSDLQSFIFIHTLTY